MSIREDFEEHRMPSGVRCFYKDDTHAYFKDIRPKRKSDLEGEWQGMGRLTGVSTVVGPADFNPTALMRWSARTNGIGVAMLAAEASSFTTDQCAGVWASSRKARFRISSA